MAIPGMTILGIESVELFGTIFYTFLGLGLMGACWWVIDRFTHFSIVKEIGEQQNMALAILVGALFIALAIIISAVIRS